MSSPAFHAERQRYSHSRSSQRIARKYIAGELGATEAMKSLKRHGREGDLTRAEIALQEAATASIGKERWFDLAVHDYHKAAKSVDMDYFSPEVTIATRARVRLAQLPLLRLVYEDQRLPAKKERAMVETAYVKTVWAGGQLGNSLAINNRDHSGDRQGYAAAKLDAVGLCSELGVLALALRFPIRENLFDCWLPTPALLTDDRGIMQSDTVTRNSWDISVWSQFDDAHLDTSNPAYKLQVKTSLQPRKHHAKYADDIMVVNLYPDLASDGPREPYMGRQLIRECWKEMAAPETSAVVTSRLNGRTEQLLTILDPR